MYISPGPAGYNLDRAFEAYIGKRSPRHVIATKLSSTGNMGEKTPGPGAYNNLLSFVNQDKGVTISNKFKVGNIINIDEAGKLPGPGAYNVEKVTSNLGSTAKHVGPKFSFPK